MRPISDFNGLNDPADHIVRRSSFHFFFGSARAVAQHGGGYIYDIVGKHEVAPRIAASALEAGEDADGSLGEAPRINGLMIAGGSHDGP